MRVMLGHGSRLDTVWTAVCLRLQLEKLMGHGLILWFPEKRGRGRHLASLQIIIRSVLSL